jgi:hypothetical protein
MDCQRRLVKSTSILLIKSPPALLFSLCSLTQGRHGHMVCSPPMLASSQPPPCSSNAGCRPIPTNGRSRYTDKASSWRPSPSADTPFSPLFLSAEASSSFSPFSAQEQGLPWLPPWCTSPAAGKVVSPWCCSLELPQVRRLLPHAVSCHHFITSAGSRALLLRRNRRNFSLDPWR